MESTTIVTMTGAGKTVLAILVLAVALDSASAESDLFESRQLTPLWEYPCGIEGPAVDATGTLYVVNFGRLGTIGKLRPGASRSELFAELPKGSIGNGIRFDRDGRMYVVADYKEHNAFVFERGQTQPQVYLHAKFSQPNDLAIAAEGTIYASDPDWLRHSGRIWRITRGPDGKGRGEVMSSNRKKMSTTNGIDLSPDGKILYVGESATRELWAYRLDGGKLVAQHLLKKFSDFDLDGLRTDIDGQIYVTRTSKGTVAILSPDGLSQPQSRSVARLITRCFL
jgi:sugar lactone lactonase YvrE